MNCWEFKNVDGRKAAQRRRNWGSARPTPMTGSTVLVPLERFVAEKFRDHSR